MKTIRIFLLLSLVSTPAFSQIRSVGFKEIEKILSTRDDTVRVINFWATWCKPCTEEMPGLVELAGKYADSKFRIFFVSLDMPSMIESRLIPFAKEYAITDKVILLDEPDFNSWIPKVDEKWSGSIPATLVFLGEKRSFHEGEISFKELDSIVKEILR